MSAAAPIQDAKPSLLDVHDLRIAFDGTEVVHGVNLSIAPGERLALVGESGSGKSVTALAILRLLESARCSGAVRWQGRELLQLDESAMRAIRGDEIAMIFQEPMTALNPLLTIGQQVAEVLELKKGLGPSEARDRVIALLQEVGIDAPERRAGSYPHQLSGGQRQRVMISMALACGPDLLIADEPTTALDVTVQKEVLDLIAQLVREDGMGLLLISHDLGLMRDRVQEVMVMYGGQGVECAPTEALFAQPAHPYTRGLFAARARLGLTRGTRLHTVPGQVPQLHEMSPGCAFADRCAIAQPDCVQQMPPLQTVPPLKGLCSQTQAQTQTQMPTHVVRCPHWSRA